MAYINDYISKLSNISENIDNIIRDIVEKHEGKLLGTVKLRLYQKSLDANLRPLGEYSPITKKRKKEKGQISNRVTLRDTGEFYDSMFIVYESGEIIVDSSDDKASELEHLWGEAILGLSEPETVNFVDTILEPELEKLIDFDDLNLGEL